MNPQSIKYFAALVVAPPLAGYLIGQFTSELPNPYRLIAFGLLAAGALCWAGYSMVDLQRDRRRNADHIRRQNEMLLGVLYGTKDELDEATRARLHKMTVPEHIDLQAHMMMQRHVLEQMQLMELDYAGRERVTRQLRATFIQLTDSIATNDVERARLIQQAPDWESWATL